MSAKKYHVAAVGATGAVGQEILNTLDARNFPVGYLALAFFQTFRRQKNHIPRSGNHGSGSSAGSI